MKRTIITGFTILLTGIAILINSCVKDEPDVPPFSAISFDPEKVLTIEEIKGLYDDNGENHTFTDIYSVYATVVMDEKSGNIYKTAYIQDATGGIQLNFLNAGGLYTGDSIRVMLQGGTVEYYHGLYQVNNLDVGDNIQKLRAGMFIEPRTITIKDIRLTSDLIQSTVIRLTYVQFSEYDLGTTFADSVNLQDQNKYLKDSYGDSIIVRTSGYSNFANRPLPEGNGTFIAIASLYDDDDQLVIRSYDELQMDNERREIGNVGEVVFSEDFDDNWNDWERLNIKGAQVWERDNILGPDGSACAQISGWENGSFENEDWLVSPPINLSDYDYASIKFETARNFDGEKLKVLIDTTSNSYDQNLWIEITDIRLSSGSFNWVSSGYFVIPPEYLENFKYLTFIYESDNNMSSTWRVDNVEIKAVSY